jgi:hypothetical protein
VQNHNKSGIRIEGRTCRGIVDVQENFIFISHALDFIVTPAHIQVLADAEVNSIVYAVPCHERIPSWVPREALKTYSVFPVWTASDIDLDWVVACDSIFPHTLPAVIGR